MKKTWKMFAHQDGDEFRNFGSKWRVEMHGMIYAMNDVSIPIVEVELELADDGQYYGWLETGEDTPSMIYPYETLFSMCFPYGPKAEEDRGRGKILRFNVKKVEEKPCISTGSSTKTTKRKSKSS